MKSFVSRELDKAFVTIRSRTIEQVSVIRGGREVNRPAIDVTLTRARRLLEAAMMPSAPDGFPSSTPGNGSPGAGKGGGKRVGLAYVDDTGVEQTDWVPTSSTESAAIFARRPERDQVQGVGRKVNRLLLVIASSLEKLDAALDGLELLQSTADVADPPMCWVAQTRNHLPYDEEWDVKAGTEGARTTTFEGTLDDPFDEPRRVCRFTYRFVHRHKRLPTQDEMTQYLARGVQRSDRHG